MMIKLKIDPEAVAKFAAIPPDELREKISTATRKAARGWSLHDNKFRRRKKRVIALKSTGILLGSRLPYHTGRIIGRFIVSP